MSTRHETEHTIDVSAPATEVYRLIAEVENWPRLFGPTIFVDHVERGQDTERIRIWATAGEQAKQWTSRRTLDPAARRIDFRQEVSSPPVATMGGAWIIDETSAVGCRVRLLHDYTAVGDDPDGLAWIDTAVERNSTAELAALKTNLEQAHGSGELLMSFSDTVHIAGPAKPVYDFINEADRWAERLPHVATVRLEENEPGLQTLEMDTRTADGAVHTTRSFRVCFAPGKIVYKQTTLPPLLSLHTGIWTFAEQDGGTAATSQHTVAIRPENIAAVLGPEAGIDRAREYAHRALSTNSLATLNLAKRHVEGES